MIFNSIYPNKKDKVLKRKNTFRSFPGELKVTNSALGLRAKHPLLIAALEKVMITTIRIEMNIDHNHATVNIPLFGYLSNAHHFSLNSRK